jgi:hypothetical protein
MNALRNMALALGGDVAGASVTCPGPGHSERDRSLSVTPSASAPDGFIVFSYAGDGWRTCRDHVRSLLGTDRVSAWKTCDRSASLPADNTARAVALWNGSVDPRGTSVERYLKRRGLDLPDDIAGRLARYHESCPRGADRLPAMLTAFRLIATDRLVAVHRTFISDDGEKIDRRMLGPVAGAAIKVDDDADVEHGLTIGEGFETCLAARSLGYRPVWAIGSAGAIAEFPVLPGVDALTILAETDVNGANARAIATCANRWAAARCEVLIASPRLAGDMNDALRS